jgi:hypothetical protein
LAALHCCHCWLGSYGYFQELGPFSSDPIHKMRHSWFSGSCVRVWVYGPWVRG